MLSHRDAIRAIIDNVGADTETETETETENVSEPLDLGPGEDGWRPTAPGMSHGAGAPVPTGERRQSPQPVSPPASPQEVSPRATGASDVDGIYLRMSKKLAERRWRRLRRPRRWRQSRR